MPGMTRRRLKLAALHAARALGGFALARQLTAPAARILCYHGSWRIEGAFRGDAMFMHPQSFRRRLQLLQRLGYAVMPLDAVIAGLRGRRKLARRAVAITIDDGWYGTFADMLPALCEAGMPATLYCDTAHLQAGLPVAHVLAQWLWRAKSCPALTAPQQALLAAASDRSTPMPQRLAAAEAFARAAGLDVDAALASGTFRYMTPAELKRAALLGLDVQLHTHRHELQDLSAAVMAREIDDNRAALAEMLGAASRTHFCYPSGICSPQAAQTAKALGLESATTTVQGLAWPGCNPHLIPRLMDGEQLSEIEFEAELAGFSDLLRAAARATSALRTRISRALRARQPRALAPLRGAPSA